jgi:IS5 family transposase
LREIAMSKPREDRQKDLLRPSLDRIIDMGHALVRLAGEIDWAFLDRRFSSVCRPGSGQPPLPTRLVAGLLILKHLHNLSDEALCARWVENPYFQYFCGEQVFRHELVFDRIVGPGVADELVQVHFLGEFLYTIDAVRNVPKPL